jgi:hypothetical protein
MSATDPLSFQRIQQARETCRAAFKVFIKQPGWSAVGGDGAEAMSEARRNLAALTKGVHGPEAWEQMLEMDA